MQLLGAYVLETSALLEPWKALLESTAEPSLRPIWQRMILTSCLQSTRTTLLLQKLTDYLFANDGEQLRKLLLAMTTIEVLPNPLFLNTQLMPDLEPDERACYAHLLAIPKALTWVRFLGWLMPKMATLPPSLIMDVVPAFKTWQDAFAGQNVRYCRQIGEVCWGWLKEIEECAHPKGFRYYRRPFNGALAGKGAEKAIRAVFLASAGDVKDLATEYLQAKAADREHAHVFLREILKNCGALIRHLPAHLVDYLLAVLREDLDKEDDIFGGRSLVDNSLEIADHREFYPASPVQPPFLNLLKLHPEEGLRLIHGICNHATLAWRKRCVQGCYWSEPVTPIPISLTFPWGTQTFWGDRQVYVWFRGVWGNDAIESALMALEQWALEQLDQGAAFEEIFRKVVERDNSVTVLGIGVSLCLAHPRESLPCAFPLVTCPYLWGWDIERLVQDHTPTNAIGNWHLDRYQLSAVKALNERPHRKQDIRQLLAFFVCSSDRALVDAFTIGVRSFPENLPLSYEEEKANAGHLAALREQMKLFAEQADPQNFKAAPTQDGQHIQIWSEPPSLEKEEYKEQQRRHLQLNDYLAVAMWANKTLENGSGDERFSLEDALVKARSWDMPDLFDMQTDALDDRHRASAVVGTAFVAARFCSAKTWTDELAAWCFDVIERAATGPEAPDALNIRMALLLMHPAVYAAHGYSALLARKYQVERCQKGLLNLATDALQGVQVAVYKSAKYYATAQPEFYWMLVELGLRLCIVNRDDIWNYNITTWDEREADVKLALLDHAEASLVSKTLPSLPIIPLPWVKIGKAPPGAWRQTKGYARNDVVFLYNQAGEIIPEICLEAVLTNAHRRPQFLAFVSGLLEYTSQELVPPFAKSHREYDGNAPFEWVFDISSWCGSLFVHLTRSEADEILSRIWSQDTESALMMMQGVMRIFVIRAFSGPTEIQDEHLVLWSEMVEWLFRSSEWEHNYNGRLDREFTSCAFTTLFCFASDFSPLVCGIGPGWPHLQKFLPIIQRAICEFGLNETLYLAVTTFLKRAGIDLMPDPALAWLLSVVEKRKADQEFWELNGENTVEILKLLVSQKAAMLGPEHRKSIDLIADILIDNGVRGAGFLQQELSRAE